ncbi:MAG: hypothetical protein ACOYX1_14620 [Acidobacteriota bacterium]
MPVLTRRTAAFLPALLFPNASAGPRVELRDRHGALLGWIAPRPDGVREARDRTGRLLGFYHPRQNETRGRTGQLLYRGDALAALIVCHG